MAVAAESAHYSFWELLWADLIGAIKHYSENHYNIGLNKLIQFMECTENAFKSGKR